MRLHHSIRVIRLILIAAALMGLAVPAAALLPNCPVLKRHIILRSEFNRAGHRLDATAAYKL